MIMKILGRGPGNCQKLAANLDEALKELQWDAQVIQLTTYTEVAPYGVVQTPALLLDEKFVLRGQTPTVEELITILKNYQKQYL